MDAFKLTPEQAAEVQRIKQIMLEAKEKDIEALACELAIKETRNLLGQTKFDVRDKVHRIGAKVIQTVLNERKKGGGRF